MEQSHIGDEPHDLSSAHRHEPAEQAVADRFRRAAAVADLDARVIRRLVDETKRHARRRRHRRLFLATTAAAAGVVCITGLAVAVTDLPGRTTTSVPASGNATPTPSASMLGYLTTAQVQQVISDAQPLTSSQASGADLPPLLDACGTAPLQGVEQPLRRGSEEWASPSINQEIHNGQGKAPAFSVTLTTFATPEAAEDYARALRQTIGSCSPAAGEEVPVNPVVSEVFLADALYINSYSAGRVDMTSVVVSDSSVSQVHGWVKSSESQSDLSNAARTLAGLGYSAIDHEQHS